MSVFNEHDDFSPATQSPLNINPDELHTYLSTTYLVTLESLHGYKADITDQDETSQNNYGETADKSSAFINGFRAQLQDALDESQEQIKSDEARLEKYKTLKQRDASILKEVDTALSNMIDDEDDVMSKAQEELFQLKKVAFDTLLSDITAERDDEQAKVNETFAVLEKLAQMKEQKGIHSVCLQEVLAGLDLYDQGVSFSEIYSLMEARFEFIAESLKAENCESLAARLLSIIKIAVSPTKLTAQELEQGLFSQIDNAIDEEAAVLVPLYHAANEEVAMRNADIKELLELGHVPIEALSDETRDAIAQKEKTIANIVAADKERSSLVLELSHQQSQIKENLSKNTVEMDLLASKIEAGKARLVEASQMLQTLKQDNEAIELEVLKPRDQINFYADKAIHGRIVALNNSVDAKSQMLKEDNLSEKMAEMSRMLENDDISGEESAKLEQALKIYGQMLQTSEQIRLGQHLSKHMMVKAKHLSECEIMTSKRDNLSSVKVQVAQVNTNIDRFETQLSLIHDFTNDDQYQALHKEAQGLLETLTGLSLNYQSKFAGIAEQQSATEKTLYQANAALKQDNKRILTLTDRNDELREFATKDNLNEHHRSLLELLYGLSGMIDEYATLKSQLPQFEQSKSADDSGVGQELVNESINNNSAQEEVWNGQSLADELRASSPDGFESIDQMRASPAPQDQIVPTMETLAPDTVAATHSKAVHHKRANAGTWDSIIPAEAKLDNIDEAAEESGTASHPQLTKQKAIEIKEAEKEQRNTLDMFMIEEEEDSYKDPALHATTEAIIIPPHSKSHSTAAVESALYKGAETPLAAETNVRAPEPKQAHAILTRLDTLAEEADAEMSEEGDEDAEEIEEAATPETAPTLAQTGRQNAMEEAEEADAEMSEEEGDDESAEIEEAATPETAPTLLQTGRQDAMEETDAAIEEEGDDATKAAIARQPAPILGLTGRQNAMEEADAEMSEEGDDVSDAKNDMREDDLFATISTRQGSVIEVEEEAKESTTFFATIRAKEERTPTPTPTEFTLDTRYMQLMAATLHHNATNPIASAQATLTMAQPHLFAVVTELASTQTVKAPAKGFKPIPAAPRDSGEDFDYESDSGDNSDHTVPGDDLIEGGAIHATFSANKAQDSKPAKRQKIMESDDGFIPSPRESLSLPNSSFKGSKVTNEGRISAHGLDNMSYTELAALTNASSGYKGDAFGKDAMIIDRGFIHAALSNVVDKGSQVQIATDQFDPEEAKLLKSNGYDDLARNLLHAIRRYSNNMVDNAPVVQ